ncbi:uncharacterized protein LOC143895984 isoform X2 [Temnothorax americanus]|uniref:uncharacterized protein LOC143895984 isoform X2 n=1 Tax=Temnothorax americanus TaxID=1964332 RepID=UPI0040695848
MLILDSAVSVIFPSVPPIGILDSSYAVETLLQNESAIKEKKFSKMSKNKHYASVEKKIFLEILKDFKHVIEVKKSDSSTLRDKEIAWDEICNRYNDSSMIFQERTVAQLKKLWTNMKQNQRELLTKEKQARLATGGGPPPPETNIDPDVAAIAPHLLETAPILFTSNMTDNEIKEMEKQTLKIVTDNDSTIVISESNDDEATNENKIQEVNVTIEDTTQDKENQNIDFPIQGNYIDM